MTPATKISTIKEYIEQYPKETQVVLKKVYTTIKKAAPGATECIKYGIPTFVHGKNLVHFGGYGKHIGFYPTSSGIQAFKKELTEYKTTKGTVQFPLDKPITYEIITKIVKFRVKENSK